MSLDYQPPKRRRPWPGIANMVFPLAMAALVLIAVLALLLTVFT